MSAFLLLPVKLNLGPEICLSINAHTDDDP
jgi:hypothetical protein